MMVIQGIFRGQRMLMGRNVVTLNGQPLDERYDLHNHSPDGFNWGYGGSGPAQLALAMLAPVSTDKCALHFYQRFKFDVITGFDHDTFEIRVEDVRAWIVINAARFGGPVDGD
jgi:hypothetical protein